MSTTIPPAIAPRLGSLLKMLGSPIDNEALTACRMLSVTLAKAGCDLHDLAEAVEHPPTPMVVYAARPASPRRSYASARPTTGTVAWPESYKSYVRSTLERGLRTVDLTEWEEQFIRSVLCRLYEPQSRLTNRQAEVVSRLLAKIGDAA